MWFGLVATLLGAIVTRGRDFFDFSNEIFGSFVAITGDAHQAKVAQDIFRQEIRYEKSLQIREDIRDVNKMMLESVQTHLFVGSIILGVCFAFFIEGYPPDGTNRLLADLWIVSACWSCSFTLIAQWLALCFQAQISHCARERLLRKHRFQMPDDQVVGKMGGGSLVNQIGLLHDRLLELVNSFMKPRQDPPTEKEGDDNAPFRHKTRVRRSALKVQVEAKDGRDLDAVPVKKGMHAWLDRSGTHLLRPSILDIPTYLFGETMIRSRWFCYGVAPLSFRVRGEATLYIAAQCPPGETKPDSSIGAALRLNGQVPEWPEDQLPLVSQGYHAGWRGLSGSGEFKRVNGFSVFVDSAKAHIEMPIYKIVLASPPDDAEGYVNVQVDWRFKTGCEGLLVVLRRGHVHCKEEDWPIVEFNEEIKQVMPLRDYSGLYTRYGMFCLILAAIFTAMCRLWVEKKTLWWFEVALLNMAIFPAILGILFIPIHQTGAAILGTLDRANLAETQGEDHGHLIRGKPLESPTAGSLMPHLEGQVQEIAGIATEEGTYHDNGRVPHWGAPLADTMEFKDRDSEGSPGRDSASKWRTGSSPIRDLLSPRESPRRASVARRSSQDRRGSLRNVTFDRADGPAANHNSLPGLPTAEGLLARLPNLQLNCSDLETSQCKQVMVMRNSRIPPSEKSSPRMDWPPAAATVDGEMMVDFRASSSVELEVEDDLPQAAMSDLGFNERIRGPMKKDELVVQGEHEVAISRVLEYVPELIRPIDADKPLMVEGHAAKSLRLTLRKFRLWTNSLRILFVFSFLAALASPYSWFHLMDQALTTTPSPSLSPAGAALATAALAQLRWQRIEVGWPAFFHPTVAALGMVNTSGQVQRVLWLAADGLLRAFVERDGGSLHSPGPVLLLPHPVWGLDTVQGVEQRLRLLGDRGLAEVDMGSASLLSQDQNNSRSSRPGPLDTQSLNLLGTHQSLPPGLLGSADASSAAFLPGLEAVAVAMPEVDEANSPWSRVYLCGVAANASTLSILGHMGPLPGTVRAMHGCGPGVCASQPVLWVATSSALLAVDLETGKALAAVAAPEVSSSTSELSQLRGATHSSGEAGVVVALTGNETHLLVVLASGGRRPEVYTTPHPSLPNSGAPLLEL